MIVGTFICIIYGITNRYVFNCWTDIFLIRFVQLIICLIGNKRSFISDMNPSKRREL